MRQRGGGWLIRVREVTYMDKINEKINILTYR